MFTNRLTNEAKNILAVLNLCLPVQTYLAGGTGLALHLNHRDSYDLDLYSPHEYNLEEIRQRMEKTIKNFQLISSSWQTIIGKSGKTEISLFYYKYEHLNKPLLLNKFPIASIEDIAAMKIDAIAGRGLKRDFFDLYSICTKKNMSLLKIIQLNQNKYQTKGSNIPHILKSLVYFVDAETKPERATIVDQDWQKVKQFFLDETKKIFREMLR